MTVKDDTVLYQHTPEVGHPHSNTPVDQHPCETKCWALIGLKCCQGDLSSSPEQVPRSAQSTLGQRMGISSASGAAQFAHLSLLSCLVEGCTSTFCSLHSLVPIQLQLPSSLT